MRQGMGMSAAASAAESGATAAGNTTKPGSADPATGKKVLYWHDPMVTGQKFEKPGKSPVMDMMLVPVYADGDSDQGQVTVSPRVQQSLGVRTAEVEQGTMAPQIEAVGGIAFNERDQYVIQARATGYVERLYVRATLDRVRRGQPLVDLYVPDWVAAQEEVLSVQRMRGADLAALADVARQRMRQAGRRDQQIRSVEASGKVRPGFTLTAARGGATVESTPREGETGMPEGT